MNACRPRTDTSSSSSYGRWETSVQQGGTIDPALVGIAADAVLAKYAWPRGQYTVKVLVDAPGPQPFVDFGLGDWVYLDRTGTLDRYRVRQLSLTWSDDDGWSVLVTLNDSFDELDILTARKVDGILGGASAGTVRPANEGSSTKTIPGPPTGVVVSSANYLSPNGRTMDTATVSWVSPTLNTDGTAVDDLTGYEIEVSINGAAFDQRRSITASPTIFTELTPGQTFRARVRRLSPPRTVPSSPSKPIGAQLVRWWSARFPNLPACCKRY